VADRAFPPGWTELHIVYLLTLRILSPRCAKNMFEVVELGRRDIVKRHIVFSNLHSSYPTVRLNFWRWVFQMDLAACAARSSRSLDPQRVVEYSAANSRVDARDRWLWYGYGMGIVMLCQGSTLYSVFRLPFCTPPTPQTSACSTHCKFAFCA